MKYREGETLFYVNPFVFTIDKVKVQYGVLEHNQVYYIDKVGAYLAENCLFRDPYDARMMALTRLEEFFEEKKREILHYKGK